jgi:phosphatidylserine/phosphatidylglycerophosphate/cardiolipin synthase-like enzyme
VDAENYFEDLYEKLNEAKESIYIAGWWVSPELYLKRPVSKDLNHESRLMDILKKKALDNVQVHILVYKEVSFALGLNSNHTKDTFNKLHNNIKVTRHPKSSFDLLWSHHEKIVVIDQRIGYVGGIDLCWGRYDTNEHRINEETSANSYIWPGMDYSNARIKDFVNLANYELETINRDSVQRMPWHDVAVCVEGPVVADLTRHFVERWNFARDNIYFQHESSFNILNGKINIYLVKLNNKTKQKFKKEKTTKYDPQVPIFASTPDNYKTYYLFENRLDETLLEKEEYQEIRRESMFQKLKGYFGRVKNRIKTESKRYFNLLKHDIDEANHKYSLSLIYSKDEKMTMRINEKNDSDNTMKCHLIRSAAKWSVGLDKKDESSILNAYYHLIDNAKHYIMIENQFFISKSFTSEEHSSSGSSSLILNE